MSKCQHGMMAHECMYCSPRRSIHIETHNRAIRMLKSEHTAIVAKLKTEQLEQLEKWLDHESYAIGAVDGYDYNSGVEYGLRKAAIEVKKRKKAILNARIDKESE